MGHDVPVVRIVDLGDDVFDDAVHWKPHRPFRCPDHGIELVDEDDPGDFMGVQAYRLRDERLGTMAWRAGAGWAVAIGELESRTGVEALGFGPTVKAAYDEARRLWDAGVPAKPGVDDSALRAAGASPQWSVPSDPSMAHALRVWFQGESRGVYLDLPEVAVANAVRNLR